MNLRRLLRDWLRDLARAFATIDVQARSGRSMVMRGPDHTDARNVGRNALVGFFLLTFALSWTAWLAPVALGTPGNSGFSVLAVRSSCWASSRQRSWRSR